MLVLMLQIDDIQLSTELEALDELCLCRDSRSAAKCVRKLPVISLYENPLLFSLLISETTSVRNQPPGPAQPPALSWTGKRLLAKAMMLPIWE